MLHPSFLYNLLHFKGIDYTIGVPDSLLKYYCAYAFEKGSKTITANEGGAIALAAGYHLATGKIPLVYMQNSGFGNSINPLTSLVDEEVYSIPMLLLIGWRGQPDTNDEPQHIKQGKAMEEMLEALKIPYCILSNNEDTVKSQINKAFLSLKKESKPYALLVPKNTFQKFSLQDEIKSVSYPLKREQALNIILDQISNSDIVISTTGKTSREIFELRKIKRESHYKDFLTLGSMGYSSQIALGIALEKPNRKVYCIDGDGAVIMHMGGLAIIGEKEPENFKHIIINNGAHESVGGQPTVAFNLDFEMISKGCGYNEFYRATNLEELKSKLSKFILVKGPALLEIMTSLGSRSDLGRPTISPLENKKGFMNFLSSSNAIKKK